MKKEQTETKMVKCPGCGLELPENDVQAQVQHMESAHPNIIGERHRAAGIHSEYTQSPAGH
jgi:ribosomal protein S26